MNWKDIKKLSQEAKDNIERHRFSDAAQCLEKAAIIEADTERKVNLWQEAAALYRQTGECMEAASCYLHASELLETVDKASCLMASWKCLIFGIVTCEYDCSWEWRGDLEEHVSSHDVYQRGIQEYQAEAERTLSMILRMEGFDGRKILNEAKLECKRLEQEGGWGASRCTEIIENATNKS
jgi:hypothetical protein